MGSKPAVTKNDLIEAAYRRAHAQGLGAVGMREVARDCGVAVGTVYNYFPSKAALTTEVIKRFWMSVAFSEEEAQGAANRSGVDSAGTGEGVAVPAAAEPDAAESIAANQGTTSSTAATPDAHRARACFSYREGENLVGFCRRIMEALAAACAEYRSDWLGSASSLDARTKQSGRVAEQDCFEHIREGLAYAIEHDPGIDPDALRELGAYPLACFIWTSMHGALAQGERDCPTLLTMLELALYRPRP